MSNEAGVNPLFLKVEGAKTGTRVRMVTDEVNTQSIDLAVNAASAS